MEISYTERYVEDTLSMLNLSISSLDGSVTSYIELSFIKDCDCEDYIEEKIKTIENELSYVSRNYVNACQFKRYNLLLKEFMEIKDRFYNYIT